MTSILTQPKFYLKVTPWPNDKPIKEHNEPKLFLHNRMTFAINTLRMSSDIVMTSWYHFHIVTMPTFILIWINQPSKLLLNIIQLEVSWCLHEAAVSRIWPFIFTRNSFLYIAGEERTCETASFSTNFSLQCRHSIQCHDWDSRVKSIISLLCVLIRAPTIVTHRGTTCKDNIIRNLGGLFKGYRVSDRQLVVRAF